VPPSASCLSHWTRWAVPWPPWVRAVLLRDDDYATAGKPPCDWDDRDAREALVDALVRDALFALSALDGHEVPATATSATELLALVAGQDVEVGDDGIFRIVSKVAKDTVISTVDPEARHGHKSRNRHFDGYKGRVAVDPDSEMITATTITPGNTSDGSVATDLISDLLGDDKDIGRDRDDESSVGETAGAVIPDNIGTEATGDDTSTVYGDNAYGTGEIQSRLEDEGIEPKCKTQRPTTRIGFFAKDRFVVNLEDDTVTSPNGVTVTIRRHVKGSGLAKFSAACASCPLRSQCTKSAKRLNIAVRLNEAVLTRARKRQRHPEWVADYRATRPKVERKIGHLMRRKHGGMTSTGSKDREGRCRLQPLGCRSQPGAPRNPRSVLRARRMDRGGGVKGAGGTLDTSSPPSPLPPEPKSIRPELWNRNPAPQWWPESAPQLLVNGPYTP
jgi:hypothetical protein